MGRCLVLTEQRPILVRRCARNTSESINRYIDHWEKTSSTITYLPSSICSCTSHMMYLSQRSVKSKATSPSPTSHIQKVIQAPFWSSLLIPRTSNLSTPPSSSSFPQRSPSLAFFSSFPPKDTQCMYAWLEENLPNPSLFRWEIRGNC